MIKDLALPAYKSARGKMAEGRLSPRSDTIVTRLDRFLCQDNPDYAPAGTDLRVA